jgi:hypothetical protein
MQEEKVIVFAFKTHQEALDILQKSKVIIKGIELIRRGRPGKTKRTRIPGKE